MDIKVASPFVAAAIVVATLTLCGQRDRHKLDVDALALQPGTEVIRTTENGKDVIEMRRNGVLLLVRGNLQGDDWLGIDETGLGAVMCHWQLYIEVRSILNVCFPDDYAELREDLTFAIDAINDFIMVNNPFPIARTELQTFISHRQAVARTRASRIPKSEFAAACRSDSKIPGATVLSAIISKAIPRDERKAEVAKLLSVPRWPVMGPCL
jgi:hypothetical protein